MELPDTFREICYRLEDHAIFALWADKHRRAQIELLFANNSFWRQRSEFIVQRKLTDRPGANWSIIYYDLRAIRDAPSGSLIHIHAMNDINALRVVEEAYGRMFPPSYPDLGLAMQHTTSPEVLRYLVSNKFDPPRDAALLSLLRACRENDVEMVNEIIGLLKSGDIRERHAYVISLNRSLLLDCVTEAAIGSNDLILLPLVHYALSTFADVRQVLSSVAGAINHTSWKMILDELEPSARDIASIELGRIGFNRGYELATGEKPRQDMFDVVSKSPSLYSTILSYIVLERPSDRQLVSWLTDRRDERIDRALLCALDNEVVDDATIEPIRALVVSLAHPNRSLEELISDLRRYDLPEQDLIRDAQLIGAYRAGLL